MAAQGVPFTTKGEKMINKTLFFVGALSIVPTVMAQPPSPSAYFKGLSPDELKNQAEFEIVSSLRCRPTSTTVCNIVITPQAKCASGVKSQVVPQTTHVEAKKGFQAKMVFHVAGGQWKFQNPGIVFMGGSFKCTNDSATKVTCLNSVVASAYYAFHVKIQPNAGGPGCTIDPGVFNEPL